MSTVNISFNTDLLKQIDQVAQEESRSRSELIRRSCSDLHRAQAPLGSGIYGWGSDGEIQGLTKRILLTKSDLSGKTLIFPHDRCNRHKCSSLRYSLRRQIQTGSRDGSVWKHPVGYLGISHHRTTGCLTKTQV